MTLIARFAALLVALTAFAGAAFADPFTVRDLKVDVTAGSAVDAQRQGLAQARQMGAQRLINRLTLPEDRSRATRPIDVNEVARLVKSTETGADEKRTATRYIATLIVNFDAGAVREYLDARGVPFVETQAGRAMIAPAVSGLDPQAWAATWAGKTDNDVLTPYVVSVEAWDRKPAWQDVAGEVGSLGAIRAVVAEAYSQNGQTYVRLTDVRSGAVDTALAIAGPFGDLASAQAGAVETLENTWKAASIVRTTGSTNMELTASFRDLPSWATIRKGLESSRLVSNLVVESLSTTGADMSFVYAGRPDQLAADLRAKGLDLRGTDNGWTIATSSIQ
jgi:hypothetical protein